jgi:hypothetical protein
MGFALDVDMHFLSRTHGSARRGLGLFGGGFANNALLFG